MTAIVDLAGADNRDGLSLLLAVLPASVRSKLDLYPNLDTAIEIVMDLGRCAEIRFPDKSEYITDVPIDRLDLEDCVSKLGSFSGDNRAGIERTLHRISCLRNRNSEIIGLTCRVGRSITGAADKVRDLLATGKSILLLGRPGVGKSTTLREIARILSDDLGKRVVIIDSSNEIAGDGDIPHAAIGRARRMQVARPELQHHVMIEAVENHMPQVIIIDEIGTELEAIAARTIAERGVQLIGTAHGNYLENLLKNPTLSDLIGGIGAVTLGDDEARKRGTQKTVLERKAPPTFDIAVEMHQRDRWVVHESVSDVVDTMLRGRQPTTQVRTIDELGNLVIRNELPPVAKNGLMPNPTLPPIVTKQLVPLTVPVPAFVPSASFKQGTVPITIYCHDLDLAPITKLIAALNLPISITKCIDVADAILTLRQHTKNDFKLRAIGELHNIPIYSAKSGTISQLTSTLNRMVG